MRETIVFVHGMFMNGASWGPWVEWFGERGHECLAPSWPGHTGDVAALRATPDPALATLRLSDVVASFRAVIEKLPAPPILVGHSMGGLVVQLLLNAGLGSRGVVIAPAPPQGVRSFAWSHLRSNSALLWPGGSPIVPTWDWFRYAFVNVQPEAEARALFEQWCVCESRLVGKGPLGDEAAIDFAKTKVPLHFIAGGSDHIIPPALVRQAHARYEAAGTKATFEELAGHSHALCIEARWREVAERTASALA